MNILGTGYVGFISGVTFAKVRNIGHSLISENRLNELLKEVV